MQTYRQCGTGLYQLQIWKAADGDEFLLNDRLVDFEGHTSRQVGCNIETSELVYIVSEDRIRIWLLVSPQLALAFCNPKEDVTPDQDAKQSQIRIQLSLEQRVSNAYTLAHAQEFVVFRKKAAFERARREFAFSREQVKEQESTEPRKSGKSIGTIIDRNSKRTALRSWRMVWVLSTMGRNFSLGLEPDWTRFTLLLEQAYPPKRPDHQDLTSVDFLKILQTMSEEEFAARISRAKSTSSCGPVGIFTQQTTVLTAKPSISLKTRPFAVCIGRLSR